MDRLPERISAILHKETSAGIALMLATALALFAANSQFAWLYAGFLETYGTIGIGALTISKPLLLWINDGLMAIFFFLVGLEIKREILTGELSSFDRALLPILAAIGGMAGPALVFVLVNWGTPANLKGWAIPAATDIAFALGILALIGTRAPTALKILLLAIAIIDDLGAIIIIALFYSNDISVLSLTLAGAGLLVAIGLNLMGVSHGRPYLLVAVFVWVCVLKSGVHATLAGVLIALTIPLRPIGDQPPLAPALEHDLHTWVNFLILPVFAFANAGVNLAGVSMSMVFQPLPLGIALGLFIGKQAGVFLVMRGMTRLGITRMPTGITWLHVYGLALLTGVGFTMSLFIGSLAYVDEAMINAVRMGVLMGSAVSAIAGFAVLWIAGPGKPSQPVAAAA